MNNQDLEGIEILLQGKSRRSVVLFSQFFCEIVVMASNGRMARRVGRFRSFPPGPFGKIGMGFVS